MKNREGSRHPDNRCRHQETMYENFTDAENTGAPLVPQVEESNPVADGGQRAKADLEEVVLSHRLRE